MWAKMKTWMVSSSVMLLLPLVSQLSDGAPCSSSQLAAPLVVKDSAGVLQLVATANCSGGSFDVKWVGSVIVEETIRLFGGMTLNITGADEGTSVVDGANRTSLFEVDGGTLHLHLLSLVNGTGDRGGAIYSTGATITASSCIISNNAGVDGGGVFLNDTVFETTNSSFAHNTASGYGGAVYGEASSVTFGDNVRLERNEASFGGALYATGRSNLALTGDDISLSRNTASTYGGGLYVHQSTANVTGKTELVGNAAQVGGAIYTDNGSFLLSGDTLLSDNFASDEGGAFYSRISAFDIAGTAIWENNSALSRGGALSMSETTWHVKALGKTIFVGNAAEFGGAAYTANSVVVFDGDADFTENHVSVRGGGLYSNISTINISGNALWENNRSPTSGGGVYTRDSDVNVVRSGRVKFNGNIAEFGGGAHIDTGMLLTYGDAFFSNNNASANGGALYVTYSDADIAGYSLWENNTAQGGGGALSTLASNFSVPSSGRASFVYNNAFSVGGAVYVAHCSVLFDGDVRFSNNAVVERGGAFHSDQSAISIAGTVLWTNNTSEDSGGASAMWASDLRVQPLGRVEFTHNAARNGGAMSSAEGTVSLGGDALFANNTAEYVGGALVCSDSDVDISGTAVWKNNTALGRGGAIQGFDSIVTVQSSGTTEFVSNDGTTKGGAAYAENSPLLFMGEVFFNGNVAETGGALYIDESVIVINQTTEWNNNSAQNSGGGVYIWMTTLHVTSFGTAVFFGNDAEWGGALYPFESEILFEGNVRFATNSATEFGGAVFSHESAVNIKGTVSWDDNACLSTGGGVALVGSTFHVEPGSNVVFSNNTANVGGGMWIGERAEVVVTGLATFTHNHAETGAGIKMAQFSSANTTGGLVTMRGNVARSSGGGMHCESPTLLRLDGVQFISNYARVSGGALTTLSAGIVRVNVTEEAEPTIITNCSFSANSAADAGGAFFVGGGFVDILDSRFSNNFAGRSGGALLASGVVSLHDCLLLANHASVGPAVTNTVTVAFSFVQSINNTLWCDDRALFLDWNDTASFSVACESCSGVCSNCTLENPDRVQVCRPVLEHTTSTHKYGDLESLSLQTGFWRSSPTSEDVLECYETSACVGGTHPYCREGYQGPFCAVCADGYTSGLGYTCSECSANRRIAAIVLATIGLVAVVATVSYSLKFLRSAGQAVAVDNFFGAGRVGVQPIIRARAFQALKVLVVSWQIVTQFSMVASVVYPDIYNTLLKYADVVNLNVGWMLSAGCLIDTDFYHNLLLTTILPLVVLGGVFISHKVITSKQPTRTWPNRARIDRRHASVIFWVSFLCYTTVSSTIFQTFACDDLDIGMSYLRVDHSLECYTAEHTLFKVYAGVMSVVYPFGIPFCYAVFLYRGRAALKDPVARETFTTDGAVLRELWIAYRPEAYFYEVVESLRRVVLSGVIVFIFPNTAGQIATAFLLALFFAAVFLVLDPYTSSFDTWAARMGHTVVLMSMFVALLQKVEFGGDDDFSQHVFAVVLVLANAVMIAAAGAEACGMCVVAVQEVRQPVATLSRNTTSISGRSTIRQTDLPVALGEDIDREKY